MTDLEKTDFEVSQTRIRGVIGNPKFYYGTFAADRKGERRIKEFTSGKELVLYFKHHTSRNRCLVLHLVRALARGVRRSF